MADRHHRLVCGAIVLQNVPVLAQLTRAQAQTYTVRIDWSGDENGGSGVLVKELGGNRYRVLTNCHVLRGQKSPTPDAPVEPVLGIYTLEINGNKYSVNITSPQCHPRGIDLAIIEFQADRAYPVPAIRSVTNLELLLNDPQITVAGFNNVYTEPISSAVQNRRFQFGITFWKDRRDNIRDGYDLVHDYETRLGMSGGPIFDAQGNLVAINGETSDEELKDSAAIPIHYYTSWQQDIPYSGDQPVVYPAPIDELPPPIDEPAPLPDPLPPSDMPPG